MKEFLLEKNRTLFFEYFNVNKKKFFLQRFVIALLFLTIYVLLANFLGYTNGNMWLIGIPFVAFFGYKVPYIDLLNRKSRVDIIKQHMFPNFLRYFISLLSTQGNVYLTLQETIKYVQDPLKREIVQLINDLDNPNVQNYEAFMRFAEFIDTSEAILIMNMINDFNEQGINKDDIRELETIVIQLQENKTNEYLDYSASKMEKHANPILVYSLVYVIAFVGVVFMHYLGHLSI